MRSPVNEGLQHAAKFVLTTESVENLLNHLIAGSFLLKNLSCLVISH
jgi:hypothetical protein